MDEDTRKRLLWLDALEGAGVDNWGGIEYAHELYEEYLADEGLSQDD